MEYGIFPNSDILKIKGSDSDLDKLKKQTLNLILKSFWEKHVVLQNMFSSWKNMSLEEKKMGSFQIPDLDEKINMVSFWTQNYFF